ncbi:MAG: hypothetical protein K2L51_00740 [Clostridiales bacterium]|nr:hypothetical protein [Clostridiales bacterium]
MKKEFTFKNYFLYVARYWLVTAIIAVVGLAAGVLYGILGRTENSVRYTGSITMLGLTSFTTEELRIPNDSNAEPVAVYNLIRAHAFSAMNATQVRYELYAQIRDEWMSFSANKKSNEIDARDDFFNALDVREQGISLQVSFTQKEDADKAFSQKAVTKYIELAEQAAYDIETVLQSKPVGGEDGQTKLSVGTIEEETIRANAGIGVLKGALVGAVGGVILGLLVVLIMYFADRRINTYGDIAPFTGRKLLGVSSGTVSNKVCPRIDCEASDKTAVMICGDEDMCRRLTEMYGEYASAAERKTLRIDFSGKKDGDSFGDYMRGKELSACLADENGVSVLCGTQSWALALTYPEKIEALKKQFGRVIIAAPYRGDGSLGVLARVSDAIVYAVNQSTIKGMDVLNMAQEAQCDEKAVGAVLEKTGKSYVGGSVYIEYTEEE